MTKHQIMSVFSLILVVFALIGCSGGSSPVSPPTDTQSKLGEAIDSLPIIGATMSDETFNALGLLGAYELRIDPKNITAELVSKRLPSLGQSWIVSGIGFFTIAPCSDCLQVQSIALSADGNLQLTFAMRHPFKPGVTSLPPSAVNRLDLDVFDVALVVSPIGTTPTSYSLTSASIYSGFMVNNAGYTTELEGVTGDQAAMPYALVVNDSLSGTGTWNEFSMGADKTFDVFFDLSMPAFVFDMYLTMGYGASAQGKSQRLTPTYFNPEFNRKSAWKVAVIPPQGTDPPAMGNTWDDADNTALHNVTVHVYDWQHGVTTIANPPIGTGDIAFASDVSKVTVEIPGMTSTLPESTTAASGTGSPSDPLVFVLPIANENLLSDGEYVGLVKVSDERVPDGIPPTGTIDFLIDAPDGITLTNYEIPEFATYQTFVATVVVGAGAPTCVIQTTPDPPTVVQGETITLDGSSSSCINPITTYEWDLDYDGVTFNVDATGAITNYSSCTPSTKTVALRVTTGIPLSTTCTVDNVTVNVDDGPIDGWGTDVNTSPSLALYQGGSGMDHTIQYGDYIITAGNNYSSPWITYVVRSPDRGQTWNAPIQVHTTANTSTVAGASNTRSSMVVDKNSNYIYMVLHSNNGGTSTVHTDIWITRSTDDGATWSTPLQINTDIGNTASQQSPSFAIDDHVTPANLYVAFYSATQSPGPSNSTLQDAFVARANANTWNTVPWATVQIDDTIPSSLQPVIRVNPVDYSVNVVWVDPRYFHASGQGRVMFDRSTDNGATFGTDVVVYTFAYTQTTPLGPVEPNMTFNSSGIPGIMWREVDVNLVSPYTGSFRHAFIKAASISGATWGTPITLQQFTYPGVGSLLPQPLSGDIHCLGTHWMVCFNQGTSQSSTIDKLFFSQSMDDGATWDTPVQINSLTYGTRSGSIVMDDCRNVHAVWPDGTGSTVIRPYYDWGS